MKLLILLAALARGAEVVVILASELKPYREALAGFQKAFKGEALVLSLADPVPREARVVVAFGGKAAAKPRPPGAAAVYGLSPGINLPAPAAKILMVPRAGELMARIRKLAPRARRLGVLHGGPLSQFYIDELAKAGAAEDVKVVAERVSSPRDVPVKLRALAGGVDLLWAPPDPAVIDGQSLEALRAFSWENDIPLFVSSPGLTARGAAASIHVPYQAHGRAAAQAALDFLEGRPRGRYYADEVETVENEEAARESGLDR